CSFCTSRRRHTSFSRDWSSDVCSSDLGHVVPADPSNPESWSGADKLAVIIETAALNEHELSEYCRKKGLYPEQVQRWREGAAAEIGREACRGSERSSERVVAG